MNRRRPLELHVEHVAGPLRGEVRRFAPDRLRVGVGTDEACAIRFPEGTPGVGVEHCELVREAGRYELRTNATDVVQRGAERLADGAPLDDGDELRLGGGDGPLLRIRYVAADRGWAYRRVLGFGAAAVALLAVGVGVVQFQHRRDAVRQRALADVLLDVPAPAPAVDWPAVVERVRPSVYAVVVRAPAGGEDIIATAWVVAPGRLATNAHVGVELQKIAKERPKYRAFVRSPVPPYATHPIEAVHVHPGYAVFHATWNDYGPMLRGPGGDEEFDVMDGDDVAVLDVGSDASLEPPLQLADRATLLALRPGDPIAFVGYPLERLVETDRARPNPRSQTGAIVSLTTFTRTQNGPQRAQLVEHSLPATGGASGSPIVNARGEVIALLNGGNIVPGGDGERTPNAALVNFAQRADVLLPLLDPAQPFDAAAARDAWLAEMRRYPSRAAVAAEKIARNLALWRDRRRDGDAEDAGAKSGEADASSGATGASNVPERESVMLDEERALQSVADDSRLFRRVESIPLARGRYLVTLTTTPCARVDAALVARTVRGEGAELASFEHGNCYAVLEAELPTAQAAAIVIGARVMGGDDAPTAPPVAKITVYRRVPK